MKIDGINVYKSQINQHIEKRTTKIEYLVIHDTSNYGVGANGAAHVRYFNTTKRKASADFIIDEIGIYQINDYKSYYTWHCGDGKGKFGIKNNNSVGLEICVNKDGNYQASVNNTIILTAYLMQELGISIDRVVRHYDASRKLCPSSMVINNWYKWTRFKSALQEYIKLKDFENNTKIIPIKINDTVYMVRSINNNGYNFVNLREICKLLNISVEYKDNNVLLKR